MSAPTFFTPEWATAVGAALQAGPDEAARAAKLPEYWDFYDVVRDNHRASWALGVRDLPAELGGGRGYLRVAWAGGRVEESRIVGAGEPPDAGYVLAGDYAGWRSLYDGYGALRTVMYRRLILEEGRLLDFFKSIYFFVESLALLAATPTHLPDPRTVSSPA